MSLFPETIPFVAVSCRSFGCVLSLPFGDALSPFSRLFLSLGLALLIVPAFHVSPDVGVVGCLLEFVIGFLIGAPLRVVVDASEMVGELLDTARGQTISAVNDPLNGQGGSDAAIVAKVGATALALWGGGLDLVIVGLADSLNALPVGAFVNSERLAEGVLRSFTRSMTIAVSASAVWLGAYLLVEVGCAMASKLVQGLSFSQVSGVAKMLITFLVLHQLVTSGGVQITGRGISSVLLLPPVVLVPLAEPPGSGDLRGAL